MLEHFLVDVATAAPTLALFPVATVRSELGIPDTSEDAKLTRLIGAASRAFAGQEGLRRDYLRQTYREKTSGDGGPLLILHRWPIESVTSITWGVEDPETIDATEYSISGRRRSYVFRSLNWNAPATVVAAAQAGGAELYEYEATYVAGWVPPGTGAGTVSAWAAATAYVAGSFVKPTSGAGQLLFECTTAGTSHASTQPTWPTVAGNTVTDGTAVWTARRCEEVPDDLQLAALAQIGQWYDGALDVPAGIQSERADSYEVSYDFVHARAGIFLSPATKRVLEGYR